MTTKPSNTSRLSCCPTLGNHTLSPRNTFEAPKEDFPPTNSTRRPFPCPASSAKSATTSPNVTLLGSFCVLPSTKPNLSLNAPVHGAPRPFGSYSVKTSSARDPGPLPFLQRMNATSDNCNASTNTLSCFSTLFPSTEWSSTRSSKLSSINTSSAVQSTLVLAYFTRIFISNNLSITLGSTSTIFLRNAACARLRTATEESKPSFLNTSGSNTSVNFDCSSLGVHCTCWLVSFGAKSFCSTFGVMNTCTRTFCFSYPAPACVKPPPNTTPWPAFKRTFFATPPTFTSSIVFSSNAMMTDIYRSSCHFCCTHPAPVRSKDACLSTLSLTSGPHSP